jgi:hypothetical protein
LEDIDILNVIILRKMAETISFFLMSDKGLKLESQIKAQVCERRSKGRFHS